MPKNKPINKPIKLALVDDHVAFQQGVETVLNYYPDMELIIKADNGAHLLHLMTNNKPDVILLDLRMPVMDGFETLAELKKLYPQIKVIILTMNIDTLMINAAMSLGAYSYLLKSADPEEIAKTIRQCHQTNLLSGPAS